MQARLLVNIFLLLIAIALVFFLSSYEDEDITQNVILTDIHTDSIDRISIRHKQRTIELLKQNQHWSLTRPVNIAANDFRIGTLLKMLEASSHRRYAADTLELEKFGLLEPATTIRFNDTEIDFGITSPVNHYRYVKTGNWVHLIDDLYYPLLSSQLGTLVSLHLVEPGSRIVKLELPGQTFSLDENNTWQSTTAIPADTIVHTLDSWKHTQAFGVHDYFERQTIETASLYLEGEDEALAFNITDTDPWLVIARPDLGIEYHLNLEAYDLLLRPGTSQPAPTQQGSNDTAVQQVSPDEFLNVTDR